MYTNRHKIIRKYIAKGTLSFPKQNKYVFLLIQKATNIFAIFFGYSEIT